MKKKLEAKLRWLKENMPSFDRGDEERICEFIIPLIMEGTTEEGFREKATRKDPNWSGRDFFLFTLLVQKAPSKFIQETQAELEKARKKIMEEGENEKKEKRLALVAIMVDTAVEIATRTARFGGFFYFQFQFLISKLASIFGLCLNRHCLKQFWFWWLIIYP